MIKVLVTYKVKTDRVQENEELIKAVYDELRQNKKPPVQDMLHLRRNVQFSARFMI